MVAGRCVRHRINPACLDDELDADHPAKGCGPGRAAVAIGLEAAEARDQAPSDVCRIRPSAPSASSAGASSSSSLSSQASSA